MGKSQYAKLSTVWRRRSKLSQNVIRVKHFRGNSQNYLRKSCNVSCEHAFVIEFCYRISVRKWFLFPCLHWIMSDNKSLFMLSSLKLRVSTAKNRRTEKIINLMQFILAKFGLSRMSYPSRILAMVWVTFSKRLAAIILCSLFVQNNKKGIQNIRSHLAFVLLWEETTKLKLDFSPSTAKKITEDCKTTSWIFFFLRRCYWSHTSPFLFQKVLCSD